MSVRTPRKRRRSKPGADVRPRLARAGGKRRKPRRWRRISIWLAALFCASVALGYWASRPARVARWVASIATERSGLDVSADRVLWLPGGKVRIENLVGRVPGLEGPWGQLSSVAAVELDVDLGSGLRGDGVVTGIELYEPQIVIAREPESGRYNVEAYTPPSQGEGPTRPAPPIRVRDGRLVLALAQPDGVTTRLTLAVDGSIEPDPNQALGQRLDLIVQRAGDNGLPGRGPAGRGPVRVQGRIAPDGVLSLEIDRLQFDDALAVYLPPEPAMLLRRAKPEGLLRDVRAVFDPNRDDPAERLRDLRVVLDNVRLGPRAPLPQLTTDDGRIAGLDGAVRWTPGRVHFDGLAGELLGLDFHAVGETAIDGSDFDLKLTVGPCVVPELLTTAVSMAADEIATVWRLRGASRSALTDAAAVLDAVRPSGLARADVALRRTNPNDPPTYEVRVELLDASFAYEEFRYPVQSATGLIVVADGLLELRDIRGVGPEGGAFHVRGRVDLDRDNGVLDVRVNADAVPVDATLLRVLPVDVKEVIDRLIHQESARRLGRAGVVTLSDTTRRSPWLLRTGWFESDPQDGARPERPPTRGEAPEPPPFTLGGHAEFSGWWRRAEGDRVLGTVTVRPGVGPGETEPALGVVYRDMPYPLTLTGGEVVVDDDGVTVQGLEAHGPTGATARFDGRVAFSATTAGEVEPGVRIEGVEAPIDEVFIAALPDNAQDAVHALGLQGLLKASGLYDRAAGRVRVEGETTGASLAPPGLPWTLTGVDAGLSFSWTDAESGDAEADWGLRVAPRTLRVERGDEAVTLEVERGALDVSDSGVDVVDLLANHPTGTATADGSIGGPGASTNLLLAAQGSQRGALSRAMLPEAVTTALDQRQADAAWSIESVRLIETTIEDEPGYRLLGDLRVRDGAGQLGLPIDQLDAHATFNLGWTNAGEEALPALRFDVRSLTARVAGRSVDALTATLTNRQDRGVVAVEGLLGQVGGGLLTCPEGWAQLTDGGAYRLRARLSEARLDAILIDTDEPTPDGANAPPGAGHADARRDPDQGLVTARIDLAGQFDKQDSLHGRAKVGLRNASLYNQPLALGLLQNVNLIFTLESKPFDRGRATIVLQGRTAWIEEVLLESDTFALVGAGDLDVPTGRVRLDMQAVPQQVLPPVLSGLDPILQGLRRQVAVIRVRGPLDDPAFAVTPPGVAWLSDAWDSFFRSSDIEIE
ncbi:MAG: hypothetical protein AAF612_06100 [Planctomycetota bacterium]